MLYWGREGEGLQVSPRPTINTDPVLDLLVFKARRALHSLDPEALARGWIGAVYPLDTGLHHPGDAGGPHEHPWGDGERDGAGTPSCHGPRFGGRPCGELCRGAGRAGTGQPSLSWESGEFGENERKRPGWGACEGRRVAGGKAFFPCQCLGCFGVNCYKFAPYLSGHLMFS